MGYGLGLGQPTFFLSSSSTTSSTTPLPGSSTAREPAVRGVQEGKCGPECAVCLTDFSGGDVIRLLTVCCHAFHPACINSWLASHPHNLPRLSFRSRGAARRGCGPGGEGGRRRRRRGRPCDRRSGRGQGGLIQMGHENPAKTQPGPALYGLWARAGPAHFLSVFLFRDLLHYAPAWLVRSEGAGGEGVQEGKCGPECAVCLADSGATTPLPGSSAAREPAVRGCRRGSAGRNARCAWRTSPEGTSSDCLPSAATPFIRPTSTPGLASHPHNLPRLPFRSRGAAAVLAVREAVGGGGGDGLTIDVVEEDGEGQSGRMRKSRSRSLSSIMDRVERG